MNKGKGQAVYLELTWFFCKTYFFNPLNNPIFVVLFFFVALFYWEGSLDKYHLALIMYLTLLSHYFVGSMFRSYPRDAAKNGLVPLLGFFKTIPVPGRKIFFSYLFSAFIYVMLIYVFLGLLLIGMMRLPDLTAMKFVQAVASDGDTLTTLTGYAYTPRGIPYFVSLDWNRSILFDAILRAGGAKFWLSLYFVIAFLYLTIAGIFQQVRRQSKKSLECLLHKVPLGFYLLLGLVFITEIILSQNEIGFYSRFMLVHLQMTESLFLAVVVITVISIVVMSRSILASSKRW